LIITLIRQYFDQLIASGVDISNEILKHLSPYWTEHLNQYGIFLLDLGAKPADIEYELNRLEIEEHVTEITSALAY